MSHPDEVSARYAATWKRCSKDYRLAADLLCSDAERLIAENRRLHRRIAELEELCRRLREGRFPQRIEL